MCGITGYSGKGDSFILDKMNETLHHRGPDDCGKKVFDLVDGRYSVGLAHSRLSIIDLSPAGGQPMSNEDGTVWIVFNGEIYNFVELRRSLKIKHVFKSQSDTEVIIHLYEEIGVEAFSMIQGMFAIALYDSRMSRLILVRDRMGKKPLYWSLQDDVFVFGSELKALMMHPSFKKKIDIESLNKYFLYEYVPTPHTIFEGTWKLEPGTILIWDGKTINKKEFWKPTFLSKEQSFETSLERLGASIESSVKDRLVSDVPLGVFLSGGLDSSLIAYYATKVSSSKIKTFSIGFIEKSFDESAYARQVSMHLGTEHYEKILSARDCIDLIPKIGELLDEPMADASIVPTYLLSQFAREHVTVAMGGDGGDELFFGYDTLLAHKLSSMYAIIPRFILYSILNRIVHKLPTAYSNMSMDFKIKKFIDGYDNNANYRNQRWLGAFDHGDREQLFSSKVWDTVGSSNEFDDIDRYLEAADSHEMYDELGLLYERMYMMDQILVKVDRASMMNSLEVRAPFLDTRVVDIANHMPADFKFKGLERKYILKKLMEGKLPHSIIYRKKKGFGMPVGEWLRGELKSWCDDLLSEESLKEIGLFNLEYVYQIREHHHSGKANNHKKLWTLLIFVMWWRKWMR